MSNGTQAVSDRARSTSTRSARGVLRRLGSLTVCALCVFGLALTASSAAPAPPPPAPKPAAPPPPVPAARLSKSSVPAKGKQEVLLSVEVFGRYAIRATSTQGSAVRVIDRMAGELGAAGEAGHENGRLDLFLDRGTYKIVVVSSDKGDGTAQLSAVGFHDPRDANTSSLQLVETKLVRGAIQDLQQVSYWLQLSQRSPVRLEAAGRDLADLRLWRDGSWLEDVTPDCAAIDATPGQPLFHCEVATSLNAGLYLVTLYGGPGQPWSIDAPEHPLYLRWGYPHLAETGRRHYQLSPFGEDRFVLPAGVDLVHVEIPKAQALSLTSGWLEPWQSLVSLAASSDAQHSEIKKNSVPPVATIGVPAKPGAAQPPAAERAAAPAVAQATIDEDDFDETTPDDSAATAQEPTNPSGSDQPAADQPAADQAANDQAAAPGEPDASSSPADAPSPSVAQEGDEPTGDTSATDSSDTPAATPDREETTEPAPNATAETQAAPSDGPKSEPELYLAVKGTPGQDYVLEHFTKQTTRELPIGGRYFIGTVSTGDPRDSVDTTALLTSHAAAQADPDAVEHTQIDNSAAIVVDSEHAWARKFNLLAPLDAFVSVREKGSYEIVASGNGTYRLEPFLIHKPKGYEAPAFAKSGSKWNLDAGVYLLSAQPGKKGIVTVGIRPTGKFPDLLREAGAANERNPVIASIHLGPVDFQPSRRYTLRLNNRPGVDTGIVLRRWPLDLSAALPIAQRPEESLALEFTVPSPGTLRAETVEGRLVEMSVDGAPGQNVVTVTPGAHRLDIHSLATSLGPSTQLYTLAFEPAVLAADAPLPPIPTAALAALPTFPLLRPGASQALDLTSGASATFLVNADKPALYQLQTTGVLATAMALRTRTVTSIAQASANGIGRNALVRQYLREGDFQATVRTVGRSQGHLRVELAATPLREGGEIHVEVPARITLGAGEGVAYSFDVPKQGSYHLLAMGLGFVYSGRLEDADGWPVVTPNQPADFKTDLSPGHYRLVLLPQPVGARAVTLLHREPEPPQRSGHGPHALPLGHTVEHVWQEPAVTAETEPAPPRPPDVWVFDLPAQATTTLTLDAEMEGSVTRAGSSGTGAGATAGSSPELAHIPPGRSVTVALPAGRYQVAVTCSRRNSLVRYHLRATTAELVDGDTRVVDAPVSLPVSIGTSGLVEISSYAANDVRARLYAADGTLVADEDDRPDDWNFLISESLPAGAYRLDVEPVGRRKARLRLNLHSLPEAQASTVRLPVHQRLELAGNVRLLELMPDSSADLLIVDAKSLDGNTALGIALEARDGKAWRRIANQSGHAPRLAVPLDAPDSTPRYRLRLWSLDPGPATAVVALSAIRTPRISERKLAQGAELPPVAPAQAGFAPLAAAVIELDRPGIVHLHARGKSLEAGAWRGSSVVSWPAVALGGESGRAEDEAVVAVAASGKDSVARLWVVADAVAPSLKGERVTLPPGRSAGLTVALPAPSSVATWDLGSGAKSKSAPPTAAGPIVAIVTAPSGQPAIELGEAKSAHPLRHAATLAVGPHSALSVALAPQQPVAWTWSGEPQSSAGTVAAVRLTQQRFAAPLPEAATWGITNGSLRDVVARQLTLPAGQKRVRLSLGRDTVAVLSDEQGTLSTHWTGGTPFEELLDGSATRLTLLHLSERTDPFAVELLASAQGREDLELRATAPFVSSFDRAGILRLRLPAAASTAPIQVWTTGGAAGTPIVLDDHGGVWEVPGPLASRAPKPVTDKGGVLLIPHGPGVVLAWASNLLTPGAPTAAGEWQGPLAAPSRAVTPPSMVPLSGHFAHLSIEASAPAVLHVRAATEALAVISHGNATAPQSASLGAQGVHLDTYLPAGTTHVGLAALGDGALSGFAELTTSPVLPTQEGLGPEVMLPAGATRYFSFHVTETRTIGWSAASDSERVGCDLLHGDGRRVFADPANDPEALVALYDLEPGDYLLAVTAPANSAPLRVRPVVVGLEPPSLGPPEDVVRSYLRQAGAQFAATEQNRPETHP
jgi:hypothetical protein